MGDVNLGLIIGISAVALVLVLIILTKIIFVVRSRKDKIEIKSDAIDNNAWVNALGGNENIISLEAKGSRLIVKVNKNELINKDELHALGVTSVIASQDKVTLVLKEKAENIRNLLQ